MGLCHLKKLNLEPQFQKYKGRIVLRSDIVKDDSGSYAVFTEQGWSASQMTAAKVKEDTARPPGYREQATDATSYTQVKMENAPTLLKILKSENFWRRLPKHKWAKSWSSMEDQVVPLERNLYGHPSVTIVERQIGKVLLQQGWAQIQNWECLFGNRRKGRFLSVCVADIKMSGKKRNLDPTWKIPMKDVDFHALLCTTFCVTRP